MLKRFVVNKSKSKFLFFQIGIWILSLFFTSAFFITSIQLSDYQLKLIADQLIESGVPSSEGTKYFLRVNKIDTQYQDIYSAFDYSLNNESFNIEADNKCFFDDESIGIRITTQVGSELIQNDYSGQFYYLSTGHFFTIYGSSLKNYFGGNERWYLSNRGCDSFIFISDTFADYLIHEKYHLDEYSDPYKELIINHYVLNINYINELGERKTMSYAINDIITSTKRQGIKYKSLYNFYANVPYSQTKNIFNYSSYLNFKNSAYAIKTCLNKIKLLGYNSESSKIDIMSFDKGEKKLVELSAVSNQYRNFTITSFIDVLWYFLLVMFFFIQLLILLLFIYNNRVNKYLHIRNVVFYSLLLLASSIMVYFGGFYFCLSIIPAVCFAVSSIFGVSKVLKHVSH